MAAVNHSSVRTLYAPLIAYLGLACQTSPLLAQQGVGGQGTSHVATTGYTGAINTPSADVILKGSTTLSMTNSIPEVKRQHPDVGGFGSLNWGFGVLPGMEMVGRLSFDGDLQCNMYMGSACQSSTRDLSVSAKYQLPLQLPLDTRLAVGISDFGGAATNYRQRYAVGTSTLGPVDISLGYSRASSPASLINGVFGSVAFRAFDHLTLLAEADKKHRRVGAQSTLNLSSQWDVQLGLSRAVHRDGSAPSSQQVNQMTAGLHYFFEKRPAAYSRSIGPLWLKTTAKTKPSESMSSDEKIKALSQGLKDQGFANIHIAYLPADNQTAPRWWLRLDPIGWRQDRHHAIAAALVEWMRIVQPLTTSAPGVDDAVVIALTYMGQAVAGVSTSRHCLKGFAAGEDECGGKPALVYFAGKNEHATGAVPDDAYGVRGDNSSYFRPQIELGLGLRTTVGTEYGLVDYSSALDVGMQLPIARGLFWQGNMVVPLAHSEDFKKEGVFSADAYKKVATEQSMLSYLHQFDTPAKSSTAVQLSLGAINAHNRGGQMDASWLSSSGNWRVAGTHGIYHNSAIPGVRDTRRPALLSVRHSVIPGLWQLDVMGGQFLGQDKGIQFASRHWFGDHRLSFYLRQTMAEQLGLPSRTFAGFEISFPFGPSSGAQLGGASVRGRDRWGWGLATKIGDVDNLITHGYGNIPRPRHGVWTDVEDYDRGGAGDMWSRRHITRAALNAAP